MKTERVTIPTSGGIALEGRWDLPEEPEFAVLFCHPHPQQGGTMTAPLMHKVTKQLVDLGAAVLRFNFRGVGASEGEWGGGIAEVDDVGAAFAVAAGTELAVGVAGWSFGGGTALAWQAATGDASPFAGIAAAISLAPDADELKPARRSFLIGDRDQFVSISEMEGYASDIGARVVVMKGSDHFFYFREERVADFVFESLSPRDTSPDN